MTSKRETEQFSGKWSIQEWHLREKQKQNNKSLSVSVSPELFQEKKKITLCDSVPDKYCEKGIMFQINASLRKPTSAMPPVVFMLNITTNHVITYCWFSVSRHSK